MAGAASPSVENRPPANPPTPATTRTTKSAQERKIHTSRGRIGRGPAYAGGKGCGIRKVTSAGAGGMGRGTRMVTSAGVEV
ncbi:hypothetical protein Misp03_32470 [Microbispora sp. NBRC 16548]|nr:hypothetical protein Misp03_32470 [Microbispora sp. NBRC 16548]